MPRLSKEVEALRSQMIALRRDLHQHPELAYGEHRTVEKVAAFLEESGLTLRRGVGKSGLVAQTPAKAGPTVLLRVDLDALPIQEQNEVDYASRNEGVMHACGHDGHVAMGAAAARVLAGRTLAGNVRILFQPAEEGEGGAQAVIADGVMDGVDHVFGIHLWNEIEVGRLGVKEGPLMAAVDRIRIVIHGRGGHGGKPHRSADPIVAAAHVVTALQTIVSREVSPVQAAVLTLGSIHGGEAFNVIPDQVVLTGTIRTFDEEVRRAMPERVTRIAQGVAQGMQCRAECEVRAGNAAVVNHPDAARRARTAGTRVVGVDGVISPEPTMGGEDMAAYFEKAPGCFVFVGSANEARGFDQPHHSPRFDFDEAALAIGSEFLVQVAEEALNA